MFGPLQPAGHAYAAVVPAFVSAALAGEPLVVHGDGKQTRDFTFVDTVTDVIADAITRRVTCPAPLNLAFGTRTDLLTLIAELESVLGVRLAVDHVESRAAMCATPRPTPAASRSSSPTSSPPRSPTRCASPSTGSVRSDDALKRVIDVLGASAALVVLSPLLAVVAVLVRARMGPPVLFRQLRPGREGRPFELTKFRTMTDQRGPDGALLPDAQRLTALGRFLRRTSIDELPELINVVRGDMSLVGPRPLLMEYLPRYSPSRRGGTRCDPGSPGGPR